MKSTMKALVIEAPYNAIVKEVPYPAPSFRRSNY